jgi:hypothetical protein
MDEYFADRDFTHLFGSNYILQPILLFHGRVIAGSVDNFVLTVE